jgi:hypothetical protein
VHTSIDVCVGDARVVVEPRDGGEYEGECKAAGIAPAKLTPQQWAAIIAAIIAIVTQILGGLGQTPPVAAAGGKHTPAG